MEIKKQHWWASQILCFFVVIIMGLLYYLDINKLENIVITTKAQNRELTGWYTYFSNSYLAACYSFEMFFTNQNAESVSFDFQYGKFYLNFTTNNHENSYVLTTYTNSGSVVTRKIKEIP